MSFNHILIFHACHKLRFLDVETNLNKEINVARLCKTNPKGFYSFIYERRIICDNGGPLKIPTGQIVTIDIDMANAINIYFNSVFTHVQLNNIPVPICVGTQQTQDSWSEADRIPISKRCNDIRKSRFTRHTFPQHEIWLDQIPWKCNGPSPIQAVCANSDNRIKFIFRFIEKKHNVGPKTILM